MKRRFFFLCIIILCLVLSINTSPHAKTSSRSNSVYAELSYKVSVNNKDSKFRLITVLPQSIPYRQKIYLEFIPEPLRIFEENGNKYAEYVFEKPEKDFELKINVKARLLKYDLNTAHTKIKETPTKDPNIEDFLKSEKYIEVNTPEIQQIANSIKETDQIRMIHNIYNYVVENIEYGGYGANDKGAVQTLKDKKGDCGDYADLFVAICRAKNIPARRILGYMAEYTVTPKHAWAEVYLNKYGWVPFDPTMGDVKDAATRNKRFKNLEPTYIYLNRIRNDDILHNFNYFVYFSGGDFTIEDSIEFKIR